MKYLEKHSYYTEKQKYFLQRQLIFFKSAVNIYWKTTVREACQHVNLK